jgi:hypothetical protein
MTTLRVKIISYIVPDAWYRAMLGQTVTVVDRGEDYEIVDPEITNDRAGEYNNSGLICKLDAREINHDKITI